MIPATYNLFLYMLFYKAIKFSIYLFFIYVLTNNFLCIYSFLYIQNKQIDSLYIHCSVYIAFVVNTIL